MTHVTIGLMVLVAAGVFPMSTHAAREIITRETRFVLVAGEDSTSVAFAAEMASLLESVMGRYFDLPERFPQAIVLTLVPERPHDAPRTTVVPGDAGSVHARLAWDSETRLEELSRVLCEAFLRRLAFFERGQGGFQAVPDWLIDATGHRLISTARPRLVGLWAAGLLEREAVDPAFFWQSEAEPFPGDALDAFALLLVLEEALPSRADRRFFFERILVGLDVGAGFRRHLEGLGGRLRVARDASEGEIYRDGYWHRRWWAETWDRRLRAFLPRFESMAESEAMLDSLLRFPPDAEGKPVSIGAVWNARADPETTALMEARLMLLAGRMDRINPAYFNAGRSIALLFQGLLHGEPRARYLRDLTNTLTDLEDTRRLRRDIEKAMHAE